MPASQLSWSGLVAAPAPAQQGDEAEWIGTWTASPQPVWDADFFAPVGIPRSLRNQTLRQIARVSLGGDQVRVVISNEYGDRPLVIGAAHVALAGEGNAIVPGSDRALTFSGNPSATIPPGAPMVSDPVDLTVAPLGEVAVSLFLPEITPTTTWHNEGVQTAYISGEGNFAGEAEFEPAQTIKSRIFLSEIMVDAAPDARAIVTFGDSITDGATSTPDANHRWPDFLAERLHEAGARVAVLNQGISGARVLRDRMGDNALARFDRDVLSQARADTVILMMGINDIGWPDTILVPEGEPAPTADDIIAGYQQLIERAHDHDMVIIGATLDAVRGHLPRPPAVRLLRRGEGGQAPGGQRVDPHRRRVRRRDRLRRHDPRSEQPEAHPGGVRLGRPSASAGHRLRGDGRRDRPGAAGREAVTGGRRRSATS